MNRERAWLPMIACLIRALTVSSIILYRRELQRW
ncbi:UNVERIFIED_ORG: hypothetical protein J2Y81_002924 [Paraburkholderia sediminicola]|nr:hypothetical protein [Paraburkholderia sediminicola]